MMALVLIKFIEASTVSHNGGRGVLQFFLKSHPPTKTDAPHGAPPHLKMKPPPI